MAEPKKSNGKFVFFDFEATQDEKIQCDQGYVYQRKEDCDNCTDDHICSTCRKCKNCKSWYCGLKQHLPNMVVALSSCDECKDEDTHCKSCGIECPSHDVKEECPD